MYAIKFASTAHAFPISAWADKGPEKDSVNIDFMVWLMKGKNGKNILLDAGFLKQKIEPELDVLEKLAVIRLVISI